ncbi:MAG: SPOR domain-containing protein [Bdellovibrionales bacterium]|nr:SPOR domain-containing protein [Bdellovibrionales bacterium]
MRSKKPRLPRIERSDDPSVHDETEHLWAVSYADFLMVLLSFFILFFSINDIEKENVIEQIIDMTNSDRKPDSTGGPGSGDGAGKFKHALSGPTGDALASEDFKSLLDKFHPRVDKEKKALVLNFDEHMFDIGEVHLRGNYATSIVHLLTKLEKYKDNVELTFVGYSDKTPFGFVPKSFFKNNWDLSALRASRTALLAKMLGYDDDQIFIKADASGVDNLRRVGIEIRQRVNRQPIREPSNAPNTEEVKVDGNGEASNVSLREDPNFGKKLYTVQVGSYDNEDVAYEITAQVAHLDSVRVVPKDVNGKRWYRVYVGKSANFAQMKSLRDSLARSLNNQEIFVNSFDKVQ